MKNIMFLIEEKKQEFAKLPLFKFMQDKNLQPRQRLSFAPCMAHFIMSFGDLNSYVLRSKQQEEKFQIIVNKYTYEDDNHWPWFLTDIEHLGFNTRINIPQALRYLWGEESKLTRQLVYQIAGHTLQADPVIKFVVVQVLEATSDVFFTISNEIAFELQAITNNEYFFFGEAHIREENEHIIATAEAENFIAEIELTDSQCQEALYVVEKIFQIFTEWTYELLAYAQNHPVEPAKLKQSEAAQMLCL
jgi:ribosome-associated translation inhibitor RaiA